ncbi:MAG: hypothetical protein IJX65_00155 [Alistipes sp.]|nr:hypothetical protein [Alistipes sp.]
MKKTLFFALAALLFASCAKNEVVELNREAISFGDAFVENSTRAEDKTYGAVDLEAFNVYGAVTGTKGTITIYNGDNVTGEVGNDVWSCTGNQQYWIAGATYDFAAVVDATVAPATGMPTTLTTVADTDMHFKDMLYAQKLDYLGKASENDKVNFIFEHLLAKAFFTVKSNTEGGYYYSVKKITVNNFATGTYTIAYADANADGKDDGTWAGTTAQDVEFGNIENVRKSDADGKTNATQQLLVPTTGDFDVTFTVELWNDNGDAEDVLLSTKNETIPVSQDLLKGCVYNFGISLSVGELIQFTVTTDPAWAGTTPVTVL